MNELNIVIQKVKEQQQVLLSDSTYKVRRCYLNQLLKVAEKAGFDAPCQLLYDIYAADDYGSKERRFQLFHCVKLVDAHAKTHALRLNGKLYNELVLPSSQDCTLVLKNTSYPIKTLDIGFLIVKTQQAMEYLHLTVSTMGQYLHAWKDIQHYFYLGGSTIYNKTTIDIFIEEITRQKNCGTMAVWKWKINRKAAYALKEVAETGHFKWAHIRKELCLKDEKLEKIRSRYLLILKSRNLQKTTISLHDYVFRNALIKGTINTAEELNELSAIHIQAMIKGFSELCSVRSLCTLLPILRVILDFFYSEGFCTSRLSGMVMNPFIQRENTAAWISHRDERKILRQLDKESKRNKAIVLLALRLGLRDCDICSMAFQEIDWVNDKLTIIQEKTGRLLALPLLPDVGNALMDYIIDERPDRSDAYPYVFLREQAPYNKLSGLYMIFSKLADKCNLTPINGKSVGSHLYRYTLVHRLLEEKVPHQVITDALGHTSKESDKPYISMEESMLRMCTLDLSVIGTISWGEDVKS